MWAGRKGSGIDRPCPIPTASGLWHLRPAPAAPLAISGRAWVPSVDQTSTGLPVPQDMSLNLPSGLDLRFLVQ